MNSESNEKNLTNEGDLNEKVGLSKEGLRLITFFLVTVAWMSLAPTMGNQTYQFVLYGLSLFSGLGFVYLTFKYLPAE